MQHNDERPTTSGRPSLLSAEQQAEADRHRILSGLDDKPAGAHGSKRKYSWMAAALVAVVAVGAGSAVWLSDQGEEPIVLASSAPLPATPAPAAPLASDAALLPDSAMPPLPNGAGPANPEAENVSTAAILEDAPAPVAEPTVPEVKKADADELTKLLDQPAAEAVAATAVLAAKPAAKPVVKTETKAVPALVKVTDKPLAKKMVVAKATPPKPMAKAAPKAAPAKPERHPLAAAPSKRKNEVHPRAQVDSDVALLAALVAHSKANQPKRGSAAAEKLRQCKALGSASEAQACRARLCASSAKKEAECTAPRMVKAPSAE